MPDGYQAEPPRWSSEQAGDYHRYSEVNLRKPEKQASGNWWVIIAVAVAFLSVGLIAVVAFGLFFYASKSATFVTVTATVAAPAPAPAVVLLGEDEIAALRSTWVATSLTMNGVNATDEEIAKAELAMDLNGFRMDLPTSKKQGDSWTIKADRKQDASGGRLTKKIDFLVDDGSTLEAIYELDDDILKICMSQDGQPRPTDFSATKGSGRTLLVLKRKKKEP